MSLEKTLRLTLESGWAPGRGGRLETKRLYLNATIPRLWMPSRHRKRGTSYALVVEFPEHPRRWWFVNRYTIGSSHPQPTDLVGPHEHGPYKVRHVANTYTRTWATKDDIHVSTTLNRRTVSQIAETANGLNPLWVGSRFVDRWIHGAARWHPVPAVVELWMPLG